MIVVYIAGPYGDGDGYLAIDKNIAKAREAAAELVKHGFGFFCPHLNSAHFEVIVHQPLSFWYEMDIRMMYACDAVYMIPSWESSRGAQEERNKAIQRGMPVFYSMEDICKYYFIELL